MGLQESPGAQECWSENLVAWQPHTTLSHFNDGMAAALCGGGGGGWLSPNEELSHGETSQGCEGRADIET